jgi:hypothetical protein
MALIRGPQIVTNGLTLYLDAANRKSYPRTGTTWRDLSGNNNNGTLNNFGAQTFFSNEVGGSIIFDGSDDYVSLGNFTGIGTSNRTICVWTKSTSTVYAGRRPVTFATDDTSTDTPSYTLVLAGTRADLSWGGSPYDGTVTYNSYVIGTWVFLVTTINTSKTGVAYVNGLSVGTVTSTGTIGANSVGYLGRYNGFYGQYFQGSIANFSLYNRVLSASEVLQNYNATKTRFGL